MATPVKLPALGESVTEGTVTRWLKQPGDSVEVDEPLLEVSTDKVDTEIPSPVAGTLLEIKVSEDETVEVGAELALVGDESESDGGGGADSGGGSESGSEGGSEQEPTDEAPEQEASADEQSSDGAPTGAEQSQDDSGAEDDGGDDDGDGGDQEKETPEEPPAAGTADASEGTAVTLPQLGESVTEGTVTRWLKQVGDSVEVDEPLLEVSTDKVDTEIPSPVAGTVLEIKVSEDETVEVGAELAVVGSGDASSDTSDTSDSDTSDSDTSDSASSDSDTSEGSDQKAAPASEEPDRSEQAESEEEPEQESEQEEQQEQETESEPAAEAEAEEPRQGEPADRQSSEQQQAPAEPAAPQHAAPAPDESGGGSYVTPLVRKLAAQHGVDLSGIEGTGVGGRIRKQDVLAAAEQAKQAPAESAAEPAAKESEAPAEVSPLRGTTEKMSRLRKVIASRMVESLQVSAQLTTVLEVDVTRIGRLRTRVKEQFLAREGVKLSYLPFFAKAAVDTLKTYPSLNASIDTEAGEITYHGAENLGVAVDTERGLLVPVIKEAGDLSIAGLARKIADLAARTRDNKVSPDELSGGTFTLTNTGSRGALFDTPIINQPQVAILGTGAVVKRPVVIDDANLGETIAVRQMVYLALTYDHRVVDGADAARFLTAIKERLETANFEADLGL